MIIAIAAALGGLAALMATRKSSRSWWRNVANYVSELRALVKMPPEHVEAFYRSHEVMSKEKISNRSDEESVVDWYRVVNHFCALGAVEKMYIAPTIDPQASNVENQVLFEHKMAETVGAVAGAKILDLGCGRGRIAHTVATYKGARVSGLNYDDSQVQDAIAFAKEQGLYEKQLTFQTGSFNDPLPFESSSFDGGYEVGAFSYVINKDAVFSEIYRVLKPGARFSYFDWVRVNYQEEDKKHQELLKIVKPMTGMVDMPDPKEVEDAFRRCGFEVELSGEASIGGKQLLNMLEDLDKSFWFFDSLVNSAERLGLLPAHLKRLFTRLREGAEALKEAVRLDLFTMTYQIVVRKPLH